MLTATNRLLIQEILHRLEVKEPVSVDELIYLHKQATEYPEVERWLDKLLKNEEFLETELESTVASIAA